MYEFVISGDSQRIVGGLIKYCAGAPCFYLRRAGNREIGVSTIISCLAVWPRPFRSLRRNPFAGRWKSGQRLWIFQRMISEETDIEICRESSDFYNLFGRSHHPPFHRRNALIEDNGQEAQHHNGCDDHCHGKEAGTHSDINEYPDGRRDTQWDSGLDSFGKTC